MGSAIQSMMQLWRGLREKEDKIRHDLTDGIRAVESNVTVNDMFALWRKDKIGIREHTLTNYVYMYNRFIRDAIGNMKIKDVRKSDIRHFYSDILRNKKMAVNTLGHHQQRSPSGICCCCG